MVCQMSHVRAPVEVSEDIVEPDRESARLLTTRSLLQRYAILKRIAQMIAVVAAPISQFMTTSGNPDSTISVNSRQPRVPFSPMRFVRKSIARPTSSSERTLPWSAFDHRVALREPI
jgi:hypothetical protein